jgi:poly(3-hydroxybutyrate) depolymerase
MLNSVMGTTAKRLVAIELVLCALLATSAGSQKAASPPATESRPSLTLEYAGNSRTYESFIPDIEGPLPVVLLLHGSGRNGQVMIDAWKDLATKQHFILVAPNSYDPSGWGVKMDPPEFLHAVVAQVEAKHAIDEKRIYLFGHSAGAVYGLILAVIDSHFFAAVAAHAGALPHGYEDAVFARADRRTPIAIWVGSLDALFHVDDVKATKHLFQAKGFPVELSVIPNHDHNYYAISDAVNAKAWDFLKAVRLGP